MRTKHWVMTTLLWFTLVPMALTLSAQTDGLPPGVPSPISPDGKYTSALMFTTAAYQKEAFRLLIQEANEVATEMHLPENLPITSSDLTGAFIGPFGYAYVNKSIGNITTHNYSYNVAQGNKLSGITIANLDARCIKYRETYALPVSQTDTNSAYQLATQWLAAALMDVKALNRDCEVKTEISSFWNGIKRGDKLQKKTFVPIYDVSWISAANKAEGYGDVASVSLFAPTKTLLSLTVLDSKYILRKALVFTNLADLLLQTNAPPKTNSPVNTNRSAMSPKRLN